MQEKIHLSVYLESLDHLLLLFNFFHEFYAGQPFTELDYESSFLIVYPWHQICGGSFKADISSDKLAILQGK